MTTLGLLHYNTRCLVYFEYFIHATEIYHCIFSNTNADMLGWEGEGEGVLPNTAK